MAQATGGYCEVVVDRVMGKVGLRSWHLHDLSMEIGRASCRERVSVYV
jgi:hypothetical protein